MSAVNFMDELITNGIKTYIVGGYVRDRALGLSVGDHDYVVVGATPDLMHKLGFTLVATGVDSTFPVFLHPLTGDEFALARKERKVGEGYTGFVMDYDPTVTLEEDLFRRDLTINAMAREVIGWNEYGHAKLSDIIIDPFGGMRDIENKVVRHVSAHFAEDPVRLLRAARLAARYGFTVDPTTLELLKAMVVNGEVDSLLPERVWQEFKKTFDGARNIETFVDVLDTTGALQHIIHPRVDVRRLRDVANQMDNIVSLRKDLDAEWKMAALFVEQSEDVALETFASLKAPTLVTKAFKELWQFVNGPVVTTFSPGTLHKTFKRLKADQNVDFVNTVITILVELDYVPTVMAHKLFDDVLKWSSIKASTVFTEVELRTMVEMGSGAEIGRKVDAVRLQQLMRT